MVDRLSEWGVYAYHNRYLVCGNRFVTEENRFNDNTNFNGADNIEDWISTTSRITNPRLIHKELCGW